MKSQSGENLTGGLSSALQDSLLVLKLGHALGPGNVLDFHLSRARRCHHPGLYCLKVIAFVMILSYEKCSAASWWGKLSLVVFFG